MPNDALNYHFLAEELDLTLVGCRIEKINMPDAGEIVLRCHGKSTYFLLCSASASNPRVHLTRFQKENPLIAPAFLMHLRKHIGNGTITSVTAQKFERVIEIGVLCKNEFTETNKKIIVEITGTYSNIILVDENNIISEAIKHITPDISPKRLVLPGLKYSPIPPQEKMLPNDPKLIDLIARFDGDRPDKYILSLMSGMAPVTITECVYRALGSIRKITSRSEAECIFDSINRIYKQKNPCLIKYNGKYIDFCTSPFISIVGEVEEHEFLSECMDLYYANKNPSEGQNERLKKLHLLVKNAIKRTQKRLDEFLVKKTECSDCENDRIKGELITANIYRIKKGDPFISVLNYYTGEEIEISLDKNKSPAENAQSYYKKYTKKKNTLSALEKQITEARSLLAKYENALDSFELSVLSSEISDIENELIELKLLKKETNTKKRSISEFLSVKIGDFTIEIGKNNIQNERLYKNSGSMDIWLHVKDAHGSHVVIKCHNLTPDEKIIASAAALAAYYSKSKMADKVAVDYTLIKYVKPIPGSGPGRVTYTNQKTLFVAPKSVIDFS